MAHTFVTIQNVTMDFGGHRVLDDVNLRLQAGELHCLIGPNGAGKSTLFKCLTGLQKGYQGHIYLKNVKINNHHPHQIAALGVGIKTQIPNLMDNLTTFEHLWLANKAKNNKTIADKRTSQQLEQFGLTDIADQKLGEMNHGKRQIVEFSMVLAQDPWLLLLDEPAAGLTAIEADLLGRIIRSVKGKVTVLLVEHNMHFISKIAERVTVLHRGKILTNGSFLKVIEDPIVKKVYIGEEL